VCVYVCVECVYKVYGECVYVTKDVGRGHGVCVCVCVCVFVCIEYVCIECVEYVCTLQKMWEEGTKRVTACMT